MNMTNAPPQQEDNLDIQVFKGRSDIARINLDWHRLLSQSSPRRFYTLPQWYSSYTQTLEEDPDSLVVIGGYRNGLPVAILPLRQCTKSVLGFPIRVLEFPYHPHFPYMDVITSGSPKDTDSLEAMIQTLQNGRGPQWDLLISYRLLDHSPLLQAVEQKKETISAFVKAGDQCYWHPCDVSVEEMQQALSPHFRANLRRAMKKLNKRGTVDIQWIRDPAGLEESFPLFLQTEAASWKGPSGSSTAISLDPKISDFYRSLIDQFSPMGCCELAFLKVNGQCAATIFALVVDGVMYTLKIGYNPTFASHSPGKLLHNATLLRCLNDPSINAINTITAPSWLDGWKPNILNSYQVVVFNNTAKGKYCKWQMELMGKLKSLKHLFKP